MVSKGDLRGALTERFGLAEFRPGQERIIDAVLRGQPTVAVMPTGSGKSLCYQLPAVVTEGTTLVISPLIALMKDQVDALRAQGIAAAAITSASSASERAQQLQQLGDGELDLVYVAPERFKSGRFLSQLEKVRGAISLLAVDEAHCISEWGHDFRPDYLRLEGLVRELKPPRLVALTATATPEVRQDIVDRLAMENPAIFVRGFDRPNLHFYVEQTHAGDDKDDALVRWVGEHTEGSAIIYAATRKNTESYAKLLASHGASVDRYHAGLDDDERSRVQDAFMSGEIQVVVATNAFGMGVDKEDVRLVVHADLPRSPEAYYQEVGRAGRDDRPADVVLLFRHGDVRLQEFLIETSTPSASLMRQVWKLLRDDPTLGREPAYLMAELPGASRPRIETSLRYLLRAGYLVDGADGDLRAIKPGEEPGISSTPIDAEALDRKLALEQNKLRAMVRYGYGRTCRRRFFLSYFGDEEAKSMTHCTSCDACLSGESRELNSIELQQVRAVLRAVHAAGRGLGRRRLARFLTGAEDEPRLRKSEAHGVLSLTSEKYAMDLLAALEGGGLVEGSRGEYPTIAISEYGVEVMRGDHDTVVLPLPDPTKKRSKRSRKKELRADPSLPEPDPETIARLRTYRIETAKEGGVPAYVVFSNKVLMAIAQTRPTNHGELLDIPGMGKKKVAQYGDGILAALVGD